MNRRRRFAGAAFFISPFFMLDASVTRYDGAARRRGMGDRVVGEIMTKEVVTATTEDEVADLAKRMAHGKISCIVITSGRKPVGIVSERDVVRAVADRPGMLVGMKARDMMSSPVVTLSAATGVEEARRLMIERHFRRFPIVNDEGHLIGLITQTDILRK
jgi:CBS domain-containing protein